GTAATLLGAGVAYAAIPDGSGVLHACYKTNGGQLRLVNTASECVPSETAAQWNQTGAQGPAGAPGPAGPGATTFTATVPVGQQQQTLATLANGVTVVGSCSVSRVEIQLLLGSGPHLQV